MMFLEEKIADNLKIFHMQENDIFDALNKLKTKHRLLSQEEPLEEYKETLQKFIKVGEPISAKLACDIIQSYPILSNWKMFSYLADELKCLQDKESFSSALRVSFQKSSVPRNDAYRFFSNSLADSECLMNEEEIKKYNAINEGMWLFRGASNTEYQSGLYNVSWTDDLNTAVIFAFFNYPNHNPKNRVVLSSFIKKKYIKAQFDTSNEHGPESEKIVLIDNNYPTRILFTWEEFCQSDKYDDLKNKLKTATTDFEYVMNHYLNH